MHDGTRHENDRSTNQTHARDSSKTCVQCLSPTRFTEFVVDQLEACGPITSKRMFGGVGIYAGDLFFAILDNDVLYLKVDDSNRADFERVGSGPFRPYGDDSEVMQYYNVPVDVLEDATELGRWAAKAIAVARAKKGGQAEAARACEEVGRGEAAGEEDDATCEKGEAPGAKGAAEIVQASASGRGGQERR